MDGTVFTCSGGFSSDDEFFRGRAGGASSKNTSECDPRRCRSAALQTTSSAEVWFLDQLPPTSDFYQATYHSAALSTTNQELRSRGHRDTRTPLYSDTPRYHDKTDKDPPAVEQPTEPAEQGQTDNGGPGQTSASSNIERSTSTRAHRCDVEERGE